MNVPAIQPPYSTTGALLLGNNLDVVMCRQTIRQIATALKFSITAQTMLVTAASELARNAVVHGGGGRFSWDAVSVGIRVGIRLTFEDDGPGIPDISLAMTSSWSTGKGLGLGLSGAKRLVDEFEISSTPGRGTRVEILRWR